MADVYATLTGLALLNDRNVNDLGCSDLFDDAPLMKTLAATIASNGTNHKYLKQTTTAGAGFRTPGTGLFNTVSVDTQVTIALQIADASFTVEKSLADGYYKGAAEYVAREMRRKIRATMFLCEQQLIGGTGAANAAGFAGIADTLSALANSMVVNAAGTTATTGSSVYLIRTNDLGTDCQVVIGNGGNIAVGETVVQRTDDGSGKHYAGLYTPVEGWLGLQLGSANSIARIANLTADSGKGLTDLLITKALGLFPASRQPNLIVMGRRSLQQLQNSRTSYNPTGAPAEIPNQAFNIPIVVTDGIGVVEALIT
jgi:hypothetical protein